MSCRPVRTTACTTAGDGSRDQVARVRASQDPDGRLASELIDGLVRSAIAWEADPVARLLQFRTLQEAAMATSRDPDVVQAAGRLVGVIDLTLEEMTAVKS
ncbi:MAG: hypothetical protein INR70_27010 [Parafilimonas terrae]|nr:hypothetical protein [Parafilimonas terrae]